MKKEIKLEKLELLKNDIIIKGNLVFRNSTQKLEKGPKCLQELALPNYGKMRKFIILDDVCYLLEVENEDEFNQGISQYRQYRLTETSYIVPEIDFSIEKSWNYKPKEISTPIGNIETKGIDKAIKKAKSEIK